MRLSTLLFGGLRDGAAPAHLGLLLLRVFAGLAMAFAHGIHKLPPPDGFVTGVEGLGFPAPALFAWLASLAEFAGGLLLALGLLTRPAALFLLVTMTVAAFGRHGGDPFGEQELALLYASIAALFLLAGSGRFGVDAALARRR